MALAIDIYDIVMKHPTSAVTKLLKLLRGPDASIRRSAMSFLNRWAESTDADERAVELLLPPLCEGLRDRDPEIREQFLVCVAKLGLKARALAPAVEVRLSDTEEFIRRLATNTLSAINPPP